MTTMKKNIAITVAVLILSSLVLAGCSKVQTIPTRTVTYEIENDDIDPELGNFDDLSELSMDTDSSFEELENISFE